MTTESTSEIFSADQVSTCRSCSRALRGPRAPRCAPAAFREPVVVAVVGPVAEPLATGGRTAAGAPARTGTRGCATAVRSTAAAGALVRAPGGAAVLAFAGRPLVGMADVGGLDVVGAYPLEDWAP
ncbi:MAG: hypothetical protein WKF47_13315 [Geodermatophilaceae bacterium]